MDNKEIFLNKTFGKASQILFPIELHMIFSKGKEWIKLILKILRYFTLNDRIKN